MSEEENKAIDNMKSLLLYSKEHDYFSPFMEHEIDDMDIVLKLVEKQQKEIEEKSTIIMAGAEKVKQQQKEIEGKNAVIDTYKHTEKVLKEEIEVLTLDLEEMTKSNNHKLENWVHKSILNSYISKDKIREKIKEYQEKYNNYPNYTPEDFEFRQEYLHKFRALEELLEGN